MYYYNDGENEVGPFSISRLKTLYDGGLIADGTLIRQKDSREWLPLHELIAEYEAQPTPIASEPKLEQDTSADEPKQEFEESLRNDSKIDSDLQAEKEDVVDEPNPQSDGVLEPGASPAPNAGASASKLRQSYDPAYKYIPKDKRISATPQPAVASETNGPEGWLSYPPTPWRRYAARTLDTLLLGFLGYFLFVVVFYAIAPASADNIFLFLESDAGFLIDVLATGIMASLLGGTLIGVSGYTVGKLIFGIKVLRKDGSKIGFGAGLSRDLEVWFKGLGFGIPIATIFTLWFSYLTLKENKTTSWDQNRYVIYHRPSGAAQYFLNVLGLVAIILTFGLFSVLAEM